MKTRIQHPRRPSAGYALIMVLIIGAASMVVLSATMRRTSTVALQNDRNNQYVKNMNAAEAAVQKVVSRLTFDFQAYGPGAVAANVNLYRTNLPTTSENPYWSKFQFSNAQGVANRTYVMRYPTNYTGPLPSQYRGLFAVNAPVYRIVSNARPSSGPYTNLITAVQQDVLLALIPLTQYAIFYQGLLEFSTCATMFVNGRTHANSNIYVGSSSPLSFSGTVTASGVIRAPANNGAGPWSFPGNVSFNGTPGYRTNVPTVSVSINMTNTHSLIDYPGAGVSAGSVQGQQLLYNQAHIVLEVSNSNVVARVQAAPSAVQVPGQDSAPIIISNNWGAISWPATVANATNVQYVISTNFPFLTLTNTFVDQREDKTIIAAQIDVGKYAAWIQTNDLIAGSSGKFPLTSGTYPTILWVADNRRTNSATLLSAVRITNGKVPPANGGQGWSMATPNPLYVWGNYNCTNDAYLATSDTRAAYPCALMSDALTILSTSWQDSTSFTSSSTGPNAAPATTVNAAILTGTRPSTSSGSAGFSGGVHNLPRLLENWGSSHLWLNTSIINLYNSTKATGQFVTPGASSYYVPPTRHFSFDLNFLDYNKVPPGIPSAFVAIPKDWAVPPPNMVTYNITP